MKRSILMAFAIFAVLGLSIAALAFSRATLSASAVASCRCCSGDSCPLKKKDGAMAADKASCCDNCDCCKGDSCPMKKKGGAAQTAAPSEQGSGGAKTCDCSCCSKDKDKGSV